MALILPARATLLWCAVLIGVIVGCTGPLEPGRLPTAEERCDFQGGSFRAGICHTRGGP